MAQVLQRRAWIVARFLGLCPVMLALLFARTVVGIHNTGSSQHTVFESRSTHSQQKLSVEDDISPAGIPVWNADIPQLASALESAILLVESPPVVHPKGFHFNRPPPLH